MPSQQATELAKSLAELFQRDDIEKPLEVAAVRIDSFAQSRREDIVNECSKLALNMGNSANSAAQRAACISIARALKDVRKPREDRLNRISETVQAAFARLLNENEIDESFAQKLATELVNEDHLIVQWVMRVGDNGMRVKANGVTVEVEAGPPPSTE